MAREGASSLRDGLYAAWPVCLGWASRRFLALFAYGITDESFAVNMARFRSEGWDRWRALTVNQATNFVWIASTVAGVYVGNLVPAGAFGIDYALTAMFICLLTFQFRERLHILTALIAALPTLLFALKTRSLAGTVVIGMALYWLAGIISG